MHNEVGKKVGMSVLEELRRQISALDGRILRDFAERMALSAQVAEYKMKTKGRVFVPEQEKKKILEAKSSVTSPLSNYAGALAHTLLRLSRARQYELFLEQDRSWELRCLLTEAKVQKDRFNVVVSLGGAPIEQIYPDSHVVVVSTVDELIHHVRDGSAEVALIPLTDESLQLMENQQLYIQARLAHHLAIGRKLVIPTTAKRVSLSMSKPRETRELATIINIFADLDLAVTELRMVGERFFIEFLADPESKAVLQALYQLEQETEGMLLLGWYSYLA
ncbi:MAG: hypothetical protein GX971_02335 [Firmicutes bacterium]|nr:hypothetical protein [Bacillota bacterium]